MALASGRPRRQTLPWAELLRRVFSIELACPRCGGPLTVIAYLTAAPVLHKILAHLGLPLAPPALGPARDCSQQLARRSKFHLNQAASLSGRACGGDQLIESRPRRGTP